VTNKRKRQTNKEGGSEGTPEEEIVLEDMDLDVNIEDIEFPMKNKGFRRERNHRRIGHNKRQFYLKKNP
jgi:hypothetical protein